MMRLDTRSLKTIIQQPGFADRPSLESSPPICRYYIYPENRLQVNYDRYSGQNLYQKITSAIGFKLLSV
ncbi:MAG: hypothetical protein LH628_08710 [Microcoleus sp. CAN_BIN18]|nr:hypothetical protein [Microcoleus sp. CAN_BIN18]